MTVSYDIVLCLSDNPLVYSHSVESRRFGTYAFLRKRWTEDRDEGAGNGITEGCAHGSGAVEGHPISYCRL